jgi:hypothetical protein
MTPPFLRVHQKTIFSSINEALALPTAFLKTAVVSAEILTDLDMALFLCVLRRAGL